MLLLHTKLKKKKKRLLDKAEIWVSFQQGGKKKKKKTYIHAACRTLVLVQTQSTTSHRVALLPCVLRHTKKAQTLL